MTRLRPEQRTRSIRPLCLVGMSGIGKSFWARRLVREEGFVGHDCDGAIGERLRSLLEPGPSEERVHALGRWMGMPWSEGYAEREALYLALEEEVTAAALDAASSEPQRMHVVDTTGSVVYLSPTLLGRLRASCRVVYLRAPVEHRDSLLQRYLEEPKPVVWAGAFGALPGEAPESALSRSYAALLASRDARYEALAEVVLDGAELEGAALTTPAFLERCHPLAR